MKENYQGILSNASYIGLITKRAFSLVECSIWGKKKKIVCFTFLKITCGALADFICSLLPVIPFSNFLFQEWNIPVSLLNVVLHLLIRAYRMTGFVSVISEIYIGMKSLILSIKKTAYFILTRLSSKGSI